ncbi:hypothetical protein BgiBS90_002824 [Biomphalaria glabrata]|nr:hypothetical protein BgiBS90_002824 [Biomphalaria glabrata]
MEALGSIVPSVTVVGKSCGGDFQDEKRDDDCCDDLSGMFRIETKETNNEETREVSYVLEAFVPSVSATSTSMSRKDQNNICL